MSTGLQDRATLAMLHGKFHEAFQNNEFGKLGELYSDTTVLMPPGKDSLVGRDNILEFWRRARRVQNIEFKASEALLLGNDVLRESGTIRLTIMGRSQARVGAYMSVWVKFDGDWRLDSCMWRAAGAPQANQKGLGGGRNVGGKGKGGGRMRAGGGRPGAGRSSDDDFGRRGQRKSDQLAPMVPIID